MIVPCLNARHGCPVKIRRMNLGQHLVTCPANVITCTMSWNRSALAKHDRSLFLTNQKVNQHAQKKTTTKYLDVALASRDQKNLFTYVNQKTEGSLLPILKSSLIDNQKILKLTSIDASLQAEIENFKFKKSKARQKSSSTSSSASLASSSISSNFSEPEISKNLTCSINSIQSFDQIFKNLVQSVSADNDSLKTSLIYSETNELLHDEISKKVEHPYHTLYNIGSFSRAYGKNKLQPKRFVSQGTDPMFQAQASCQNLEILGPPEACLNNVDLMERFFRLIGCDDEAAAACVNVTRRYGVMGTITYDRQTQTLPYPAAILKTDFTAGPISSAPALSAGNSHLTQPLMSSERLGLGIVLESQTEHHQCNQLRVGKILGFEALIV